MSVPIAVQTRRPIGLAERARPGYRPPGGVRRAVRRVITLGEDGVLVLLAGLAIPVAILVIGTPIALLIGGVVKLVERLFG